MCYPIIVKFKSIFFSAYIVNELIRITGDAFNSFNESGLLSFEFIHILSNRYDNEFLNERISLFPEEDNLRIYENINLFVDRNQSTTFYLKYKYAYNDYTNGMNMIKDSHLVDYFLLLYKYEHIMIAYPDGPIKVYDQEFKNKFENELIEYFAFVIQFRRNEVSDVTMEDLNDSQIDFSLLAKPSIKPFCIESIQSRPVCEIDYGDKRLTRKELKNRKDYIMHVISTANEKFRNQIEEEIVTGKYKEKHRKVSFCIPNNIEIVINQVKK